MEPTNIRFGGGAATTILHPLVAVALLITVILTCFAPRKYVLAPWLLTALLVPFGQVVVLGGVHFTVYRIIVLFGLVRLIRTAPQTGGHSFVGGFCGVDRAFTLWALFTCIIFSIQWMEMQAFIKSVGSLLDAIGGYCVLRFLIRDHGAVRQAIKVMAAVAIVLSITMVTEQLSQKNVFGLLGGMPVEVAVREGKPRSTGAFAIYITAGVFGATVLPLLMWLWSDSKSRLTAGVGVVGATLMTITANSSTPLLAYVAAIVGLCFWPLRRRMRAFRWGLLLIIVGLHLSMNAPVWALIARIDLTGSSSGFHRYMLVDQCLRHFSDWWLVGVKNYNDWGFDMWDLCNQYIDCAIRGGLATLVMFILVISRGFGRLGAARKLVEGDSKQEWSLWCLCAALLSHVVAYFGIAYFDQMQVAWYALLAIIVAASSGATRLRVTPAQKAVASSHAAVDGDKWHVLAMNG